MHCHLKSKYLKSIKTMVLFLLLSVNFSLPIPSQLFHDIKALLSTTNKLFKDEIIQKYIINHNIELKTKYDRLSLKMHSFLNVFDCCFEGNMNVRVFLKIYKKIVLDLSELNSDIIEHIKILKEADFGTSTFKNAQDLYEYYKPYSENSKLLNDLAQELEKVSSKKTCILI